MYYGGGELGQEKAIEIMYGVIQRMTYEEILEAANETAASEDKKDQDIKAG